MARVSRAPPSGTMSAMAPVGFSRGRGEAGSGRSWLQATSGTSARPVAARPAVAMKSRRLVMTELLVVGRQGGRSMRGRVGTSGRANPVTDVVTAGPHPAKGRPEEHTSELQSREHTVCRLLLEKKD